MGSIDIDGNNKINGKNVYLVDINDIRVETQNAVTTNIENNIGSSNACRGAGGITNYFEMTGTNQTNINNKQFSNASAWCGNRYRFLYDIVYSNAGNTIYSNDWNLGTLTNYEQRSGVVGNSSQQQRDRIGGYISAWGSIPLLDINEYDGNMNIGIAATHSLTVISNNKFPDNLPQIDQYTNIWHCTAKTMYNTYVLGHHVNIPSKIYKSDNIISVETTVLNGKLPGRLNDFSDNDQTKQATDLFTNNSGQDIKDNRDIIQNILLSNFGGYVNNLTGSNVNVDPPGLLRCRESNRVTGGNISGNIKNNNMLPDTIISESGIDAIIGKFADIIFNQSNFRLGNTYQPQITGADLNRWKDKFKFRLSRAIKIVRESLFEMPLQSKYSDPSNKDYFLTEIEREAFAANQDQSPIYGNKYGNIQLSDGTPAQYSAQLWRKQARPGTTTYVPRPIRPTGIVARQATNNEYSDKFMNCDGQPLTLAFTTEFRKAFTEMVNKMIVTRQLNTPGQPLKEMSSYDSSKAPENRYNDPSFVAWCTGDCRSLITLDVSSILNIKIERSGTETVIFNYYDFLRECLDSEYNLIQDNFPDKEPGQRKCTSGLVQEAKQNTEAIKNLKSVLDDYLKSKRTLLSDIEGVEKRANEEWELKLEHYKSEARAKVDQFLSLATKGLIEKDEDKVDRGLRGVKGVFNESIQKFYVEYNKFIERDKEYDRQIKKINEQIDSIIEKGSGIGVGPLEKQFNHIQDMRIEDRAKFKEEYAKIRPYLIVPLEETSKVNNVIDKLQPGNRGVTAEWRDKVSKKFENTVKEMITLGESKVPNFKEDFRTQSELRRISDIQEFVEEIRADDDVNVEPREPGNLNYPKRDIGIWVIYKTVGRFGNKFATYGLFNILNGIRIDGLTSWKRQIPGRGVDRFIKDRKFRGITIIGTTKSNDWYLASPPPTINNIVDTSEKQRLMQYRYDLFKNYGMDNRLILKDNEVKQAVMLFANYVTDEAQKQDILKAGPIVCYPGAGGDVRYCKRLKTIEYVKDLLTSIVKRYGRRTETNASFERLVGDKEKGLLVGGAKQKKKIVRRKKRSVKRSIKRNVKKSPKKKTKIIKRRVRRSQQGTSHKAR